MFLKFCCFCFVIGSVMSFVCRPSPSARKPKGKSSDDWPGLCASDPQCMQTLFFLIVAAGRGDECLSSSHWISVKRIRFSRFFDWATMLAIFIFILFFPCHLDDDHLPSVGMMIRHFGPCYVSSLADAVKSTLTHDYAQYHLHLAHFFAPLILIFFLSKYLTDGIFSNLVLLSSFKCRPVYYLST